MFCFQKKESRGLFYIFRRGLQCHHGNCCRVMFGRSFCAFFFLQIYHLFVYRKLEGYLTSNSEISPQISYCRKGSWKNSHPWLEQTFICQTRVRILSTLVINSLTDSCYWDFIDATLAVKDFKIIVVTPAVNVSVEERADNRLVTADIMATAWQQPILRLKKAEEVKRQMNRLDEYI